MTERNGRKPGTPARGLACALGFVLTLALWITLELLLGGHILLSEGVYNTVSGDGGVISAQMQGIREEVSALAEEKGFDPDNVMQEITEEDIRSMNRASGEWLRNVMIDGRAGDAPVWPEEGILRALERDAAYKASLPEYTAEQEIGKTASRIATAAAEKSLQFREVLLRAALKIGGQKLSLQALSAAVRKLPLLTGSLGLLLAGIMVLLLGARPVLSLKYIGAALAACALLTVISLTVLPLLGIGPILSSISEMLWREYRMLALILSAESVLCALVLGCLGILGMRQANKGAP